MTATVWDDAMFSCSPEYISWHCVALLHTLSMVCSTGVATCGCGQMLARLVRRRSTRYGLKTLPTA